MSKIHKMIAVIAVIEWPRPAFTERVSFLVLITNHFHDLKQATAINDAKCQ
jgi:ABC-type dipeptide/oligopeptide/nickel transport system permease subunit